MTVLTKIAHCDVGMIDRSIVIIVEAANGRRWQLGHEFKTISAANKTAEKIVARGSIDGSLWDELPPVYGSESWREEEAEAVMYADCIRQGVCSENDVPDALRVYL